MELVARKGSLTTARDLYNSLASEMEQVLTALPPLVARGGEAQEVEGCG